MRGLERALHHLLYPYKNGDGLLDLDELKQIATYYNQKSKSNLASLLEISRMGKREKSIGRVEVNNVEAADPHRPKTTAALNAFFGGESGEAIDGKLQELLLRMGRIEEMLSRRKRRRR